MMMTKEQVIESAVADIFSSGEGAKAIRLKMVFDDNERGPGWGKPAIADKLRAVYDAALNERWTYCDDRLPAIDVMVTATIIDRDADNDIDRELLKLTHGPNFSKYISHGMWLKADGTWFDTSIDGFVPSEDVLAWRPSLEPAKGRDV